jgi:hypothetical protein
LAPRRPPGRSPRLGQDVAAVHLRQPALFLGAELAAPSRTAHRGLIGAYLVTIVIVVLAVAPLAAAPGLARTDVPGVELTAQFASTGLARAIGSGSRSASPA